VIRSNRPARLSREPRARRRAEDPVETTWTVQNPRRRLRCWTRSVTAASPGTWTLPTQWGEETEQRQCRG
jgi:hypothetical protein